MSDYDIISSSDEEDTCQKRLNMVNFQSPPRKKNKHFPLSNNSKNVIYTKDTIAQKEKDLLRSADFNRIKHKELLVKLCYQSNNQNFIYFRINELLCLDLTNVPQQKIKVLGYYSKDKANNFLYDKQYSTKVNLTFPIKENLPMVSTNILLHGDLKYTKENIPLIIVYSWKYINASSVKNYDKVLYSLRLYTQKRLCTEENKENIECCRKNDILEPEESEKDFLHKELSRLNISKTDSE